MPPEFTLAEMRVGGQEAAGLDLVSFDVRPSVVLPSAIPDPPTPSCYLRFSPPSEHWKSRPAGWELTNVCRWDSSKARHMSSSE